MEKVSGTCSAGSEAFLWTCVLQHREKLAELAVGGGSGQENRVQ
jgi:hypothetical protein